MGIAKYCHLYYFSIFAIQESKYLITMNVLFILITLSSIVASLFLIAFIWAVKSGQFDDGHTPAVRILFEDTKVADTAATTEVDLTENK